MNPLISVIIPVYNHEQELRACIASLRRQTYSNLEIIVVDDGSITPVVLEDKTISLVRQENRGAPSARNAGFRVSKGEYVIFCDADVVAAPAMLEKMYDALQAGPNAAYAYSSFNFGWKKFAGQTFSPDALKKNNFISGISLIRRGAFPGFDETLKRFQDWDLWLTMLEKGEIGTFIPELLFSVTTRHGGISSWIPSFAYRFSWWPGVAAHDRAMEIVRRKHQI